jgi:hypothetical protein
VDDRQRSIVPERFERLQSRIESEESVEIDGAAISRLRTRDRDGRPGAIVVVVAKWDDGAQAVNGAALKNGDETPGAKRALRMGCFARADRPWEYAVRVRNDGAKPRLTRANAPFFMKTLRDVMAISYRR